MKEITREWIKAAEEDLAAAKILLHNPDLSNIAAFHVQQNIEKTLKAVLEELNEPVIKSHDLLRLKNLIKSHIAFPEDEILNLINEVYVEARCPGDMGLLPNGKPSRIEVTEMITYAESLTTRIITYLQTEH